MQVILVTAAFDWISEPFSNEINFQLFFEDVFFELERYLKYMKAQIDEMTNANNHKKKKMQQRESSGEEKQQKRM